MPKDFFAILRSFFELTIVLTGVALVCYLLLGQILEITGDSMFPLLKDRERILAEKISPKFSTFKRGEIVVFKSVEDPNKLIIKRIVGLPGEEFSILNGKVYVAGKLLNEDYVGVPTTTKSGDKISEGHSTTIPQGNYVVLGDNRNESIDSRAWGFLPEENIMGRALIVYKPVSHFRIID